MVEVVVVGVEAGGDVGNDGTLAGVLWCHGSG